MVIPIVSQPSSQPPRAPGGAGGGGGGCAKHAYLIRRHAFAFCAGPGGVGFTPDQAAGLANLSGALVPGMGPGGAPYGGGGPPMVGPGPQMGGMGAPSPVPVAAAIPGQPMPKKHFGLEQVKSDESVWYQINQSDQPPSDQPPGEFDRSICVAHCILTKRLK